MGASACKGAADQNANRRPGEALVLSVVRTTAWGLGEEEDVWQVEVPGGGKVRDLKAKIEELYEVPASQQRLSLTPSVQDAALEDDALTEPLAGKRVYMNPVPLGELLGAAGAGLGGAEGMGLAEALMGQLAEAAENNQAMMESLQGVTYNVSFERPADAGGQAAGKKVSLELDALASMGIVQQMVEVEMFGSIGAEPAFLVFRNMPLPAIATLFHAGVEEGSTIQVVKERPQTGEDQLLAALAAMAGAVGVGAANRA